MNAPHFKLHMKQGADWTPTLNWYGGGIFMAPIEEIDPGYPTKIQVTGHGLPQVSATPVIISGVEGMGVLNSKDLAVLRATYVDANHFTMPVSTVKNEWIVGTGEITFYKPTDVSQFTEFRATLRSRVFKGTELATFTDSDSSIIVTADDASIQLYLTAVQTAALDFTKAYIDCEAVTAAGGVTPVFSADVYMERESTR